MVLIWEIEFKILVEVTTKEETGMSSILWQNNEISFVRSDNVSGGSSISSYSHERLTILHEDINTIANEELGNLCMEIKAKALGLTKNPTFCPC